MLLLSVQILTTPLEEIVDSPLDLCGLRPGGKRVVC